MRKAAKMLLLGKRVNPQNTGLTMTVTTTGAQTLTLDGVTVATGKSIIVDWGDGTTNTYTAGSGARTHAYAGAGVWTVKLTKRRDITALDLRDVKITALTINAGNPLPAGLTSLALYNLAGLTYNANANPLPTGLTYLHLNNLAGLTYNANTNPLPAGLTYLHLYNLAGLTYDVNANPLPTGLISLTLNTLAGLTYDVNANPLPTGLISLTLNTLAGLTYDVNANPLPTGLISLTLNTLAGLTWQINASQPWPTGATAAVVITCPNVTVSAWTDNAIRSIQIESVLSQAQVDAIVNAVWANKANFTYATPSLDILGGSMAAPSGVYQAATPPTTGKEKLYDLVNGNFTPDGPEWTVQYQA